jgi:MscS family membrane protein
MWNIARAKEQIRDVLLAHPDILGNIHAKLEFIDQYFQDENMLIFQSRGKARIISESKVIEKLDEIDITLEVFISTIEYSLKNGLDKGEIAFIQEEFIGILDLLGLVIMNEDDNSRNLSLQEANNQESLIESVRNWYREIINDENILEEDTFTISYEWELKIKVLIKRITKLAQKIMIINIDETRIYEVVADEKLWLKENFKQPQLKWQDPQVIMSALTYSEEYVQFTLLFFIDSPNFEYGKRVERITSQINEEIIKIFKKDYILGKLYNLDSLFGSDLEMESENSDISTVNEI